MLFYYCIIVSNVRKYQRTKNLSLMSSKSKKIGLVVSTSLVVGNMIGAGVYLLPATLAKYGSISLLAWIFSAIGAIILARIFSNFSRIIVSKSGGPYTYTRAGFGDFVAFLVAWGYWISIWVGNAAIAIAAIGALSFFVPALETEPLYSVLTGLGIIWLLTWINTRGIKESGRVQVATTVFKLLPLLYLIVVGLFFFDKANLPEFNLTGKSTMAAIPMVAVLTLYAFLGIECATIPAAEVKDPEKTVPRATMLGTLISTVVYVLGTLVLFGLLPSEILSNSPAPFAEASRQIGGSWGGAFVAAGAAVSAIGALNGWILISGQIPMATAADDLFPRIFNRENKKGVPASGILIGSVLTSVVMLMNYSESLVDQFEFIVLLTTLTTLIPYLFTAASYALVVLERKLHWNALWRPVLLAFLGFSYSMWAIYGSGMDTVFYGLLLLLSGIPFYVLMTYNKIRKNDEHPAK